jgi:hypothetical protein
LIFFQVILKNLIPSVSMQVLQGGVLAKFHPTRLRENIIPHRVEPPLVRNLMGIISAFGSFTDVIGT